MTSHNAWWEKIVAEKMNRCLSRQSTTWRDVKLRCAVKEHSSKHSHHICVSQYTLLTLRLHRQFQLNKEKKKIEDTNLKEHFE